MQEYLYRTETPNVSTLDNQNHPTVLAAKAKADGSAKIARMIALSVIMLALCGVFVVMMIFAPSLIDSVGLAVIAIAIVAMVSLT